MKVEQTSFFDDIDFYNEHWQGMPEFNHTKKAEKQIIVHFETLKDFEEFKKLVNQKLTTESKYMWYPERKI